LTRWWLQLLGIHVPPNAELVDWSFAPSTAVALMPLGAIALALGLVILWLYSRAPVFVSRPRRVVLALLRIAFVCVVLLLLARPVVLLTIDATARRQLLVLIDNSASMGVTDQRTSVDDLKRVAIVSGVLNPAGGLAQPLDSAAEDQLAERLPARVELMRQALTGSSLDLLRRLDAQVDLRGFTFGRQLAFMANGPAGVASGASAMQANEPATAIGDALDQALQQSGGEPLAGIVLITDGQSNAGSPVDEAAQTLKQANVPVWAWGVGITAPKQVIVADCFGPDVSFVHDPLPVTVRLLNSALAGERAHLQLLLDGHPVASTDLTLDASGSQRVPLTFTPDHAGTFNLTARLELQSGQDHQPHELSRSLRVVDRRMKVLFIEREPRWEFKYLLAILTRDPGIDLKCLLVDGDPQIAQGTDTPFIASLAKNEQDLFNEDLVILGDVSRQTLGDRWLTSLNQFVSKFGGGLLLIAGREAMPSAYADSPLADLLPVDLSPGENSDEGQTPIHIQLTDPGRSSPLLRLMPDPEQNARAWEQLPPIYWDARVSRARQGAQVLAVDPTPAKESRDGPMPVIASQAVGLGEVIYVGTDNLWRWRRNVGDRYEAALWGQMVERLALPHLLGLRGRTQLSTDRNAYSPGDPVTVYARLYDEAYHPITLASVAARAAAPGEPPMTVTLRPVPGGKGYYGAEFPAGEPGQWTLTLPSDPRSHADFTVAEPKIELEQTALNAASLRALCDTTGGAFLREEDLHTLPDRVASQSPRVRSTSEADLCFTWLYFGVLLAIVTCEWILRKMSYLK